MDELNSSLLQTVGSLQDQLDEAHVGNLSRTRDLDRQRHEAATLRDSLREYEQSDGRRWKLIEQLKAEDERARDHLTQQLRQRDHKIAELKDVIAEMTGSMQDMQKNIEEQSIELSQWEAAKNSSDSMITQLQSEWQNAMSNIESQVAVLEEENSSLQADVERLAEENSALRTERDEADRRAEEAEAAADNPIEKAAHVALQAAEAQAGVLHDKEKALIGYEAKLELRYLSKKLQDKASALDKAALVNTVVRQRSADLSTQVADLQDTCTTLQAVRVELQRENDSLRANLESAVRRYKRSREHKKTLQQDHLTAMRRLREKWSGRCADEREARVAAQRRYRDAEARLRGVEGQLLAISKRERETSSLTLGLQHLSVHAQAKRSSGIDGALPVSAFTNGPDQEDDYRGGSGSAGTHGHHHTESSSAGLHGRGTRNSPTARGAGVSYGEGRSVSNGRRALGGQRQSAQRSYASEALATSSPGAAGMGAAISTGPRPRQDPATRLARGAYTRSTATTSGTADSASRSASRKSRRSGKSAGARTTGTGSASRSAGHQSRRRYAVPQKHVDGEERSGPDGSGNTDLELSDDTPYASTHAAAQTHHDFLHHFSEDEQEQANGGSPYRTQARGQRDPYPTHPNGDARTASRSNGKASKRSSTTAAADSRRAGPSTQPDRSPARVAADPWSASKRGSPRKEHDFSQKDGVHRLPRHPSSEAHSGLDSADAPLSTQRQEERDRHYGELKRRMGGDATNDAPTTRRASDRTVTTTHSGQNPPSYGGDATGHSPTSSGGPDRLRWTEAHA